MKLEDIKKIGVAGAGTMGASIAETFAKFGYEVYLYDIFSEQLKKAETLIKLNLETEISEGLQTKEHSEQLLNKITYGTEMERFADTDFIIEAILEKMDVKKEFWTKISEIVSPTAILASNTSALSITEQATVVKNPERFAGMHWINPPHIIPLIEIVLGEKTSPETAQYIYDVCEQLGKKPVKIKDAPGFVLNRLQSAVVRESLHIVEEGISSMEDVDKVMKFALGFRYAILGPFEVGDFTGLDIVNDYTSTVFKDLSNRTEPFGILKELYNKNELGIKTGKGYYDYSNGKDIEHIRYRDEMYTKLAKLLFNSED